MNQGQRQTLMLVGVAGITYYLYTQGQLTGIIDQLGKFFENLFKKGGPTTTPPPATPGGGGSATPAGTVLYDSAAGWTDVETAASGNPQWNAGADGIGRLTADSGHGRVYIGAINFNSVMTGDFMFESGFSGADNFSFRSRSRHQEGGACENRGGGFGGAIHMDGEIEFQTESCHNNHENSINGQLSFTPEQGKWYPFRFYCVNDASNTKVLFKFEIDNGSGFETALTGEHPNPPAHLMDEALNMQKSYIWLRMNNSQTATLAFRNFKMIAQEAGSLDGQGGAGGGGSSTGGGDAESAADYARAYYTRSYRGRISKTRPRYYPYFYTQPITNYVAYAGQKRRSHAPGPGDLACIA